MSRRPLSPATALGLATAALLALAACSDDAAPADHDDTAVTADATTAPDPADETGTETDEDPDTAPAGAVVAGTGRYAIGTDLPYGGYQLHGEPAEQPAGCTWSIEDADGEVQFDDQGSYAFLTDVPEFVTFVTDGCPDWEQFE
ncbi:hypothetical protein [Cellulomonas composti]|uniref:Lipoprotein n=1 Tax=Cellulomonas composti TaxID=266130 RepID=A0A511J918_9CELL|nr:hypothetical protein [Cellulomonas composti]GEL94481.1 hypothetical protein CCO02nite_11390 [Cellulomonas composti]